MTGSSQQATAKCFYVEQGSEELDEAQVIASLLNLALDAADVQLRGFDQPTFMQYLWQIFSFVDSA